jgi:hypothetical protein
MTSEILGGKNMGVTSAVAKVPRGRIPVAVVLEGVPDEWQKNVLQVLASPTTAEVTVEGCGTIDAVAFRLTQEQARHLATQITELLGPEHGRLP